MSVSEIIDLAGYGQEFVTDPYTVYGRLRAQGPVHHVNTPTSGEMWLIVGYEEARAALADPRLSKDWRTVLDDPQDIFTISANMLESDTPRHTRLRKLIAREFTSRRIEALRPRVQEITDRLLDRMLVADRADLIEALAFPLPITVICELLGVPDLDRSTFSALSRKVMGESESYDEEARAAKELSTCLAGLIEEKRRDGPREDLLSALIRARDEEGDQLSAEELVGMAFLLLVAGHETTVNLIANGVLALLRHPDQLAALRADPGLMDGAIEEMLRYDGPVERATYRFTREPTEIGGCLVPAGQVVGVVLAAGDRDPGRYASPDTFDIRRDTRGHLAFGHGIHYCLGAPLARMEGRMAITSLLARCPELALDGEPGQLHWRSSPLMRGVHRLPVRY
ncbi:cytochrome P450 [Streptomyces sp. NBC_01190]|uniref:cytochrome P450 family protein n=1 Tax=Streptomyces sp. NBC_01190 TaxID=2903767 RepID=UPI0038695EE6|nr:cytochrome P450 [Streptomyces sp. NBC_01190]